MVTRSIARPGINEASQHLLVCGIVIDQEQSVMDILKQLKLTGLLRYEAEFEGCVPMDASGNWIAFKINEE